MLDLSIYLDSSQWSRLLNKHPDGTKQSMKQRQREEYTFTQTAISYKSPGKAREQQNEEALICFVLNYNKGEEVETALLRRFSFSTFLLPHIGALCSMQSNIKSNSSKNTSLIFLPCLSLIKW